MALPTRAFSNTPQPPRPSERITLEGLPTFHYMLLVPDGFDPLKEYPVLIALPPGNASRSLAEAALSAYWESEAKARAWVVVAPFADDNAPLPLTEPAAITALLDQVTAAVRAEGKKVHLAGPAQGGLAAFRIAVEAPSRVASITVLPGFADDALKPRLAALATIPVTMLVGDDAGDWLTLSQATAADLQNLGVNVTLETLPDQGARLAIQPSRLFDLLDARRPSAAADAQTIQDIHRVLDDFHDAASKADEARYFNHFTDTAVFLGTDATERWTKDAFRDYARPFFSKGQGWTYLSTRRVITVAPATPGTSPAVAPTMAWFDETLDNAKYGTCRGSGVLLKQDGVWKIAQYNLSVPIPNALLPKVAEQIRSLQAAPKPTPQPTTPTTEQKSDQTPPPPLESVPPTTP